MPGRGRAAPGPASQPAQLGSVAVDQAGEGDQRHDAVEQARGEVGRQRRADAQRAQADAACDYHREPDATEQAARGRMTASISDLDGLQETIQERAFNSKTREWKSSCRSEST